MNMNVNVNIKSWLREPLLHFLLIGAAFFWAYSLVKAKPFEQDPQTIVVDREKLLSYMQYRAKRFDTEHFEKVLDEMPQQALQDIIDNYVREEAMYREAKSLQLDRNDYVARLRLTQQLAFITRGFVEAVAEAPGNAALGNEAIEQYYRTHRENYRVAPKVTFTHIFFNSEKQGPAIAEQKARTTLAILNKNQVPFDKAPGYGDRFYYHLNYVKKEPQEVISHFGPAMWESIEKLSPSQQIWYGPFPSSYGYHLVMLTEKSRGYIPELAKILDRVIEDVRRKEQQKSFDEAIQTIVDAYRVKNELLLTSDSGHTGQRTSDKTNGLAMDLAAIDHRE